MQGGTTAQMGPHYIAFIHTFIHLQCLLYLGENGVGPGANPQNSGWEAGVQPIWYASQLHLIHFIPYFFPNLGFCNPHHHHQQQPALPYDITATSWLEWGPTHASFMTGEVTQTHPSKLWHRENSALHPVLHTWSHRHLVPTSWLVLLRLTWEKDYKTPPTQRVQPTLLSLTPSHGWSLHHWELWFLDNTETAFLLHHLGAHLMVNLFIDWFIHPCIHLVVFSNHVILVKVVVDPDPILEILGQCRDAAWRG